MSGFDLTGAQKAGYSTAEIANYLAQTKNFDVDAARKAGYSDQDIIYHLAPNAKITATHDVRLPFVGKLFSYDVQSTPAQQHAIADLKARPFGSGLPKLAYAAGGNVTDLAAKVLPPSAAAALGYGTDVAINAIPSFLTMVKGLPGPTPAQQSAQALAGQRQAILEKGRQLGLQVPPTQANPSMANRVLESAGGKYATAQQASANNAETAYQVAQREAGLSPAQAINKENLQAARDVLSQPYRDIANLKSTGPLSQPPFKSPAETLEALKQARYDAKLQWNHYQVSKNPEVLATAQAASAKADQLEQALEIQATTAGRPDLAETLRQARVALAKNFTVERAMRGSSFDPAALARLESRANTPLSGDLETIMQMYKDFPKAMNAPQVGGSIGVNQLLPYIGGGAGGTIGASLGGVHGATLGSMAGVAAGQIIPPAARSLLLGPTYQSLMANVPQDFGNPSLLRLLANPALSQYGAGALAQP